MNVFIIGQIGTGKTYLNDCITRELARRQPAHALIAVRPEGFEDSLLPQRALPFQRGEEALAYIIKNKLFNFILSMSETQEVAGSAAGTYHPFMRKLIFQGRHYGCNWVCDTQRAVRVSTDLFSQCMGNVFSFRQELPQDLDRAEEYAPHPGARQTILNLPDFSFYNFSTGQVQRVTSP